MSDTSEEDEREVCWYQDTGYPIDTKRSGIHGQLGLKAFD